MPWEKKSRSYRLVRMDARTAPGRNVLHILLLFFLLIFTIVNAVPPSIPEAEMHEEPIVFQKGDIQRPPIAEQRQYARHQHQKVEFHPAMPPVDKLKDEVVVAVPDGEIQDILIAYDDVEPPDERVVPEFVEPRPERSRDRQAVVVVKANRPSEKGLKEFVTTPSQIPEPGSALLLFASAALFLRRRR